MGGMPSNNRGGAGAACTDFRRERKRDLGRKEGRKGREFTFLRTFLAVKTNISGARFGRVGQRINSRFADYERDQVPSHSDVTVRGCL